MSHPPPDHTPDPITSRSLSGPILIAACVLMLALGWALYDEVWGNRPWKSYQRQFVQLYTAHLKKISPEAANKDKQLRDSPDAQALQQQLDSATKLSSGTIRNIDENLLSVRRKLGSIQHPFQDARAQLAALEYRLDHTAASHDRVPILSEIEKLKRDTNLAHLDQTYAALKASESQLIADRIVATKPVNDLRAQLSQYLNQNRDGPAPLLIDGLLRKVSEFRPGIRQIYAEDSGLVDRCESCHLGTREPIELTAAAMGGRKVFASHPNSALLSIHDPERFGCTPCHNGNGLAVSSVKEAHGNYASWEWPLFASGNLESGCQQCHARDRFLDQAPILTRGKDLFEMKGCAGCHRYSGFDRDPAAIDENQRQIRLLMQQQIQQRAARDMEIKRGDAAETNEETKRHYAAADLLLLKTSQLDAQLEALRSSAKSLQQDLRQIGPNLKDVRLKLRKAWLPQWLKNPAAFNLGTRMPRFRLAEDEVRALSAFVWQAAPEKPALTPIKQGNASNGKILFESRGCLACHSIGERNTGEENNRTGGEFAVNLSHLGQKANYDYVVNWIHNPSERSRMPNLHLAIQDARDIATYLLSVSPALPPIEVAFMDDPKLAATGRTLIIQYGCANCHEIAGFENSKQPAPDLTGWASKPIGQLDFGLLEGRARSEGWYSHEGFAAKKLTDPAIYDRGREKSASDRLKMPNIQLSGEDRRALTTFLLSTLDTPSSGAFRIIPEALRYMPTGSGKDIQDGWWLIKKYNCEGCHTLQPGQKPVLSSLPEYSGPDMKDELPPSLIEEGARVSPEWLAQFLANPAGANGNSIRSYLAVRMPDFHLSPNEVAILVRFFQALAGQSAADTRTNFEPLNDKELLAARALFSSSAAPCLRCHLYGNPIHDRQATAPNFLAAKNRLKADWTLRWLLDPQTIAPGTAMPSQLFRREGDRWTLAGQIPQAAHGYTGDHAQLLVRYMLQITPEEQRLLIGMMPK